MWHQLRIYQEFPLVTDERELVWTFLHQEVCDGVVHDWCSGPRQEEALWADSQAQNL